VSAVYDHNTWKLVSLVAVYTVCAGLHL